MTDKSDSVDDLLNEAITVTYKITEDGVMFVGEAENFPDVRTYSEFPGEAYWLVVDAIRGLKNWDE